MDGWMDRRTEGPTVSGSGGGGGQGGGGGRKKCLKYLSEKMETAGPGLAREAAPMAEKNLFELYLFLRFLRNG